MKKEIKKILDIFTKYKDDWYSCEYKLKPKQCVALYDYITNLQEENKRLNNIIDKCAEDILKELEKNYHLSYGVALGIRQKLIDYRELKGE